MHLKKYLILSFLFIVTSVINKAYAQYDNETYREDSWHVQVGVNGLYRQNPPDKYGFGAGGQVSLEYYPNNYVGVTLTTGYLSLLGKTITGTNVKAPNFDFVPVKIGLKGFALPNWYFASEFGLGYANPRVSPNTHLTKTIAPAIGYNNPDTGLDISLRYENVHHQNYYVSMIALQVAYSFNITGSGY